MHGIIGKIMVKMKIDYLKKRIKKMPHIFNFNIIYYIKYVKYQMGRF
jgi:hypothetical protein